MAARDSGFCMLHFEVECQTSVGESVAVCGNGPLGHWDPGRCLILQPTDYPRWSGVLQISNQPLEYKYLLVRPLDHGRTELVRWEFDGPNRSLDPGSSIKLLLGERFGDAAYRSLCSPPPEPSSAGAGGAGAPDAAPSGGPGGSPGTPGAAGAQHEEANGLLNSLEVEPLVRSSRLMKSRGGARFESKYEALSESVLGTGMSGGVCVARVRTTGVEVALKTLSTVRLSESQREQTLAEVQNQLSMDHPGICRLLEVYEEPEQLRLVLERLRGPDLYAHLSRRGQYSERDAAGCMKQVCSAVAYCHGRGVCHRDIKLENFCLEDDSDQARIKMIDFGLSTLMSTPMTDAVGTLYYVAPEVFNGRYNEMCDMWSVGVLAFALLTGTAPFNGVNDRETVRQIRRGTYHLPRGQLSECAASFVQALLQVDPAARMDARTALAHPWLDMEAGVPGVQLDGGVLEGMRNLTRSNIVRRAFLSAVAPASTTEEVSRWAEQFSALDRDGSGSITVQDLAAGLRTGLATSEAEALALSTALVGTDGGELVSYSAFLSACFAAHMATLEAPAVSEFFERLGANAHGRVPLSVLEQALGPEVELGELREWLAETGDGEPEVSYDDFRWLLLQPSRGLCDVRRVLAASTSHRIETVRARGACQGSDEQAVAAGIERVCLESAEEASEVGPPRRMRDDASLPGPALVEGRGSMVADSAQAPGVEPIILETTDGLVAPGAVAAVAVAAGVERLGLESAEEVSEVGPPGCMADNAALPDADLVEGRGSMAVGSAPTPGIEPTGLETMEGPAAPGAEAAVAVAAGVERLNLESAEEASEVGTPGRMRALLDANLGEGRGSMAVDSAPALGVEATGLETTDGPAAPGAEAAMAVAAGVERLDLESAEEASEVGPPGRMWDDAALLDADLGEGRGSMATDSAQAPGVEPIGLETMEGPAAPGAEAAVAVAAGLERLGLESAEEASEVGTPGHMLDDAALSGPDLGEGRGSMAADSAQAPGVESIVLETMDGPAAPWGKDMEAAAAGTEPADSGTAEEVSKPALSECTLLQQTPSLEFAPSESPAAEEAEAALPMPRLAELEPALQMLEMVPGAGPWAAVAIPTACEPIPESSEPTPEPEPAEEPKPRLAEACGIHQSGARFWALESSHQALHSAKRLSSEASSCARSLAAGACVVAADRSFQATVASAAGGAAVLGTSGGAAGLAAGSTLGAAAGIIPAIFTCGLSIPIGAVVGGGTGLLAGVTAGTAVGALGGGVTGYGLYSSRGAINRAAQQAIARVGSSAQYAKGRMGYVRARLFGGGGTGSTEDTA